MRRGEGCDAQVLVCCFGWMQESMDEGVADARDSGGGEGGVAVVPDVGGVGWKVELEEADLETLRFGAVSVVGGRLGTRSRNSLPSRRTNRCTTRSR